MKLGLPLLIAATLGLSLAIGLGIGTLGFVLYPLPSPEVQMVYVTSAPEYRVIIATPGSVTVVPEAPVTATVEEILIDPGSTLSKPTASPTLPSVFQAQLATAYPIQPTPAALLPPVRMSGGIPIRGYGYSWNLDLDKSDLPYQTGTRFCVGGN